MPETLTPQDAALALAKASRWEDRLIHRTEGLTSMIWGVVLGAIWATMVALNSLGVAFAAFFGAIAVWTMTGLLVTYAIWRSAEIARPEVVTRVPWWVYVLELVAVLLIVLVLMYEVRPNSVGFPLATMGIIWVAIAIFNRRFSRQARSISWVIGALIAAGGVILPLYVADMGAQMMGAAVIAGAIPVAGGLYQTLRG
ncbi:MAG: hypothetical protein ACYDDF_07595 [Thermoplasmatota archaeon]